MVETIEGGAIKVYRGGRQVCQNTKRGREIYRQRTEQMFRRQNGICGLCEDPQNLMSLAKGFSFSATFEHTNGGRGGGRGAGGSRRDDRIEDELGRPLNLAAHWICNSLHGSKRRPANNP